MIRNAKNTHVTEELRVKIRQLYKKGKWGFGAPALAKIFGINEKTIYRILKEAT